MTERAVSTARDGVLALDSEWRVTRANDEAGVILGQPAPALVGRSFWELVPESLGRVDEAACRRAQETGEALTLEIESADSAWRLAAVPVTGGVCVVLTDVTGWGERRWTEETSPQGESFYRQILESIPGMVFTTRADGYCDYQSRQWVEYTGVPMGEQLGDGWNSLLHPEDQARAFAAWQEAVAGRAPYDLEYRVRRLDGRYEWFRVVGRPLRDPAGRIVRWFGVALNIQDLKRTEVQLRQAKAQLEEADRRKDEFLAVLSHELRNPLAPILNGAYILERALPGGEQARRAREIIERNALQLTRLVDDLLEVTRITRGKFQLQRQEVDLATLVRRSVDDHRGVFAAAGVALDCDAGPAPVWVDGDPARLCQVLGNLLSNAAKFTQRGGRTQVSVVVSDGRAEVRVRDTGVGIGPELLPRVFEPFVQGESTLDRSRGGLGLGLPVLKGLVMLHGGTVTAHSEGAGRGAEFVVTLPTSSSRPDSPRRAQAPVPPRAPAGC